MKNKKTIIISIILIFSLLPISLKNFTNLFSSADVAPNGDIIGIEIWDQDKTIDKHYTVESGATLIIKKGVTLNFASGGIQVYGTLFIEGTPDDLVKIRKTGDAYSIGAYDGGKIYARNVDISGGGYSACLIGKKTIIDTAYACAWFGAIYSQKGKLDIQNVLFHDNDIALAVAGVYQNNAGNVKVNRSEFLNNSQYDAVVNGVSDDLDFRYNWWGSANGPLQTCFYGSCWYEKIDGNVNVSNWRSQEQFHDPVIIVPGILGSWKITDSGEWKMDPIFKTYDSLMKTFEENGYEKGKDLFVFPYQWRDTNINTAQLFKQKIQEIKKTANWPKVDVVAHSMGGLVVRQYIESDNYQNDIDQVVMLGIPNQGAPEDYLIWESGDMSSNKFDIIGFLLDKIFKQEAKHAGFKDVFDYLHNQPIKSVQELLPDYDYLVDASSGEMRSYELSEHYPKNVFLDSLNSSDNVQKLNKVSLINITGKLDKNSTINKIRVNKPSLDADSKWVDGKPAGDGLIMKEGDGTVPVVSSELSLFKNPPFDEQIEVNSSHTSLPEKTKNIVYKKITGYDPQGDVPFSQIKNTVFFFALSPIDLQIVSPSGKRVGKNFETGETFNEIPGAYYTGSDTANEFATIPNPEDGEYKILTEGTGDGEYKVEIAKISEDENNPGQAQESDATISGTATKGKIDEAQATVTGDNVTTENVDTTPPKITATFSPSANENGWNNTDVTVHFEATDDQPGMVETQKDVVLSDEGQNQSASATFEDATGNSATKTVSGISIDKTAPETQTEISGTAGQNGWYIGAVTINFKATDNLSGVDKTFYSLDGADYQTGNILTLISDGRHKVSYYSQDLAGNIEAKKEVAVNLDQTAPTVKIISPEDKTYQNDKILKIKKELKDNLSASDKIQNEVFYDDQPYSKNQIDLSLEHLGNHNSKITVRDEAGNQASKEINFKLATNIKAIISNVGHYKELNLIHSWKTQWLLEIRLRNIERSMDFLKFFKNRRSRWLSGWLRGRMIKKFQKNINRQIASLEKQIQQNRSYSKTINPKVKELLIEDLESLKV